MDISRYTYLWDDKERWFLFEVKSGIYEIVGRRKDGEGLEIIIEDDGEYEAVIQKMLNAGSKILTSEESQELFRLNIFPDVDAKTEQQMVRELVAKHGFPEVDYHDEETVNMDSKLKEMGEQAIQNMIAKHNRLNENDNN